MSNIGVTLNFVAVIRRRYVARERRVHGMTSLLVLI
jgi:hypothetical protein